jgi:hypothetical protein
MVIRLFQLHIINHRDTEKKDEGGRMMDEKEET